MKPTPALLMNIDGVLYPVAMSEEQKTMLDIFIASVSQDGAFKVLNKAPVATESEIVEKIENAYGLKVKE